MNDEPIRYYIGTLSGHLLQLDDPKDFNISDIALALSHICRWGGHLPRFWSVAQHSLVLHRILHSNPSLRRPALLHDASEAYTGDWCRPLIRYVGGRALELKQRIELAIEQHYGFSHDEPELKRWDDQIIHVEAQLFGLQKHPACQDGYNLTDEEFAIAREAMDYYAGLSTPAIHCLFLEAYERLPR